MNVLVTKGKETVKIDTACLDTWLKAGWKVKETEGKNTKEQQSK